MGDPGPYEIIWTRVAEMDLESILDFIAQRNPERAVEILQRIKTQIQSLAQHPFRSRLVPDLKMIGLEIYREWIIDPYRILLRIHRKQVVILGCFDGRRDMEEVLFERLTRL